MMDPFAVDGHGLLLPGHDLPPAAAVDAAEAWLRNRGAGDWDAFEARPDMRPTRAWWGGDELGFVGADHPQAQPVTAVYLPPKLTGQPGARPTLTRRR